MRTEMPSKEQSRQMFEQYQASKDEGLRNRIVEQYLPLVDMLVSRYKNRGVEHDDLYQIGSIALINAVERFDASKGYEFTSFATPTIIGEVKRYFRDKSWAINVPRQLKEISTKIPAVVEQLQAELARKPKVAEIAQRMNVSEEKILEAMEAGQGYQTYSLERKAGTDDESDAPDTMAKYTSVTDEGYAEIERGDLIDRLLARLDDREQAVLVERMLGEKTQSALAEELGVSQMTISRIESTVREKFKREYYE